MVITNVLIKGSNYQNNKTRSCKRLVSPITMILYLQKIKKILIVKTYIYI